MKKKSAVVRSKGQPSKYKPEYCEMLKEHMGKGFSFETFAADIDVCTDTLYEWVKVHEDFSDAFSRAKAKSQKYWEDVGIRGSNGKIRNFSSGAWSFWMKNRFKWTDNAAPTIITTGDASEEIQALAKKLLSAKSTDDESSG